MTGTGFIDLRKAFNDFRFGPPYPEFYELGQTALKESAAARAAGKPYRDSIGECYPAGMPMIMTRVRPISDARWFQLHAARPHEAWMQWRIIFTDGRPPPPEDECEPTY